DARQPVRRECNEIFGSQTARHILYIRIEAPILVHDEDPWRFPGRIGGPNQISPYAAVAVRGRDGCVLGLDPLIVLRNLFGPRIVGAKALPYGCSRQAVRCESFCALQKSAAIQFAVYVKIKQIQQFLGVVTCFLSFHSSCLLLTRQPDFWRRSRTASYSVRNPCAGIRP